MESSLVNQEELLTSLSQMSYDQVIQTFYTNSLNPSGNTDKLSHVATFEHLFLKNTEQITEKNLETILLGMSNYFDSYKFDPLLLTTLLKSVKFYKIHNPNFPKILKFLLSLAQSPQNTPEIEKVVFSLFTNISKNYLSKLDVQTFVDIIEMAHSFQPQHLKTKFEIPAYKGAEEIALQIANQNTDPSNFNRLAKVLQIFVLSRRSHHPFYVSLESIIFKNLKHVETKQLISLIDSYKFRISHDYQYIIYNIYKLVAEEFFKRFDTCSPYEIVKMIEKIWCNLVHFGFYHDERFDTKIRLLFKNFEFLQKFSDSEKFELCLNSFVYFFQTNQLTEEVLNEAIKMIEPLFDTFNSQDFISIAYYASMFRYGTKDFWKIFITHCWKLTSFAIEEKRTFGLIMMSLQVVNPPIYEMVHSELKDHFSSGFKKELDMKGFELPKSKGFEHKICEKVMEELRIPYVSEYFDTFYIDVAIIEYKIGIELAGPKHFIWPRGVLDGNTLTKQRIMERLGWKIYNIKFKPTLDSNKRKGELKEDILQILKENNVKVEK